MFSRGFEAARSLKGSSSLPNLPSKDGPTLPGDRIDAHGKKEKKHRKDKEQLMLPDAFDGPPGQEDIDETTGKKKKKRRGEMPEPKKKEVTQVDATMDVEDLQKVALEKGIQWGMVKGKSAEDIIKAIRVVDPALVATEAAPTEVPDEPRKQSKKKKAVAAGNEKEYAVLPHPPFMAAKVGTYQSAEARRMKEKWQEACSKAEEQRLMDEAKMALVKARLQSPAMFNALDTMVTEVSRMKEGISDLYHSLDIDGDGGLGKSELGKGLRNLGVSLKPSELDALMRAFDIDGNETIDYDEFSMLLSAHDDAMPKQTLDGDAALCGYSVGDRVRMAVQQCIRKHEDDGGDDADFEKGTVLGPGVQKKTVMVKLDASGQTLSLLARQIKFIEHKTSRTAELKKSLPWL